MEYENIAGKIIASLLTLVFVFIFNKYIKPIWKSNSKKATKKKERILFFARYLTIAISITLLWVFIPLNKFFVFIMSLIFSMLLIMIIYDYSIITLGKVLKVQTSDIKTDKCKRLLNSLKNAETESRQQIILKKLKENECSADWDLLIKS